MKKLDFVKRLVKVRQVNRKTIKGRIKKRYRDLDTELSWRLFQLFPGSWDDEARFKGMTLVITHVAVFVLSRIDINTAPEAIVKELFLELKKEFGYSLGRKYLKELVNQVIRIKLLNS